MISYFSSADRLVAAILVIAVVAYIGWRVLTSPEQALQFGFNGLSVGAIYALMAIGFTLVYSTVWFFDLYYGAAAALGAYGVFYLRSQEWLGGIYQVNTPVVNIIFAVVVAGVAAWVLHTTLYGRLQQRVPPPVLRTLGGILALVVGAYAGAVLMFPSDLHILFGPMAAIAAAIALFFLARFTYSSMLGRRGYKILTFVAASAALALALFLGNALVSSPGSKLYLSWVVSCLLAGSVGLALYRGLYVRMRQRSRSPLIMLVASLGILLALSASISIVFESAPRPLPDPFGSVPWTLGGANIKGFNLFAIAAAFVGFVALLITLKWTPFGRAVRAIGDDEEVARVVGINTTVIVAIVFFVGTAFAAMAGILNGHDTAIQPRMGLLLLLKGWIASVVGGIGNLYGALLGGFLLGVIEQFAIWDLAGEWKDVVAFVLLILFLSFWPQGLLPRK
ncbi:MAG: branched-chain amino acid ABC transporter permease [Chloroflexota bacterium]|nr:branched-chain amino acid ABC transporter permease [Chloroflexota bacterium]